VALRAELVALRDGASSSTAPLPASQVDASAASPIVTPAPAASPPPAPKKLSRLEKVAAKKRRLEQEAAELAAPAPAEEAAPAPASAESDDEEDVPIVRRGARSKKAKRM